MESTVEKGRVNEKLRQENLMLKLNAVKTENTNRNIVKNIINPLSLQTVSRVTYVQ